MSCSSTRPCRSPSQLVARSRCQSPVSRCRRGKYVKRSFDRNQQYSTSAITDGSGTVVERYAYTAYGTPTITDASGTTRTTTAISNRYMYTGREWDETLALYHYRARMYDSAGGRFVSRDPIGFEGSKWNQHEYVSSAPLHVLDPSGLAGMEECGSLSRRIEVVRNRIKSRNEDLLNDPLGLPEIHADDHAKPSLSRRGHRNLITQDKALLAKLLAEYAVKCGGDCCDNAPVNSRVGNKLRCLSRALLILEVIELVRDPWEYVEKETESLEKSPPIIGTPMGPIYNNRSGQDRGGRERAFHSSFSQVLDGI